MPKVVSDEQVFKAVVETIVTEGYSGTTMRQLAEAAEVNEATLFRKYGSKEQLLVKAIHYHIKQADLDSHIYYSGDIQADLLRIMTRFFAEDEMRRRVFWVLVAELPRHEELQQMINAPDETMLKIGRLFARYQAEGILHQEHPIHAMAALVGPVVVLRTLKSSKQQLIPEPDLATHVERFLNGRLLP